MEIGFDAAHVKEVGDDGGIAEVAEDPRARLRARRFTSVGGEDHVVRLRALRLAREVEHLEADRRRRGNAESSFSMLRRALATAARRR
jgi:hypothetical protein